MTDLPGDLTGNDPLVNWLNRLKRAVARRTPLSGPNYKLRQSEVGFAQEIMPGGGGSPRLVGRFRLKSIAANHLVCRSWDGETEGTEDEYVAKPPKLRNSVIGETLDGVGFAYTYEASFVQRTARTAGNTIVEIQVITPRFIVNDEIFALQAGTGLTVGSGEDEEDVVWIDLNLDARAWLRST